MPIDWVQELSAQLEWYWDNLFRPRLVGLSDEEYFWEPVAGCWNVRREADGRFAPDMGPGRDPPPVTTIAWRMCHIGTFFAERNGRHFGAPAFDAQHADWPSTAADAIAWIEQDHATWRDGVQALGADGLGRAVGPSEGPFAQSPYAGLILHINREVFHHAAEVALLRDLYRAHFAA